MSAKPAVSFPMALPVQQGSAGSPLTTTAILMVSDLLVLSAIYWTAVLGRYWFHGGFALSFYAELFPVLTLCVLAFVFQGLYPGLMIHPAEEIRRISLSLTGVFLLLASTTFVWRTSLDYSRFVFLSVWVLGVPLTLLGRYITRLVCKDQRWWGASAVLLGSGPATKRLVRSLAQARRGLRLRGMLTDQPLDRWEADLPPVLGPLKMGPLIASQRDVHYAVIVLPHHPNTDFRHLMEECCQGFKHILVVPELPGICSLGIAARDFGGEVGFEVPQRLFQPSSGTAKRSFDIACSALVLLVLSPVLALIWLTVKCSSPGSAFYAQNRFGRDGQTFRAWKFRTMVSEADKVLTQYLLEHPELRAEWARDHKLKVDPRITRPGRFLRRYSLDELPQLWNVLCGEMSLVGPRPIVQAEIARYGRGYSLYTRVRPGISGLWQVSGRNNTSYEERVGYDEYYVRNWSIWLDAYILLRTIGVVLTARGAY